MSTAMRWRRRIGRNPRSSRGRSARSSCRIRVVVEHLRHAALVDALEVLDLGDDGHGNKEPYDMSRPVPADVLARIASVARHTEVGLSDDPAEVAELRALTVRAMEIEIDTPHTFAESVEVFRIGRREVDANPDGLEFHGPMFEAMRLFGLFTRGGGHDPDSTAFQQGKHRDAGAHRHRHGPHLDRDLRQHPATQIAAGRDWLRLNLACRGGRGRVPPAEPGVAGIPRDGGDLRHRCTPVRAGGRDGSNALPSGLRSPRSGPHHAGPSRPRYWMRDADLPTLFPALQRDRDHRTTQPRPVRGAAAPRG
jgi:hypothetical protein